MVWLRVLSRTNPPPSSTPNSFRFRTSAKPRILHYFGANKSFRIRTYRHLTCNPFRMHTYKNTGGGGVAAKLRALLRSCGKSITFKRLQPLCPLSPTSILSFQQLRASFCKTPGWGYPNTSAPSFVPPSHAPRGAFIPCAVSRLRILPVTTGGVCTPHAFQISLRSRRIQLPRPLFSYSYELLFRQPLFFHNHPHCPGVGGADEF